MAEDNWAAFGTGSNQDHEGTDEWAEFGGFESAAPVTDPQATQSGLISWAAFSTDSTPIAPGAQLPMGQVPQNWTPPLSTDQGLQDRIAPSTELGQQDWLPQSTDQGQQDWLPQSTDQGQQDWLPQSTGQGQQDWLSQSQSVLANQVEIQTSTELTLQSEHPPVVAMAPTNHSRESETILHTTASSNVESTPRFNMDEMDVEKQPVSSLQMAKLTEQTSEQIKQAEEANKLLETEMKTLKGKLSIAEQEKISINNDLEELLKKNQIIEEESKTLKENMEEQKNKYSELQDDHSKQLEEIRKSGHDALAIIVEEYKALSRQAVLEQQHQSQLDLQTLLEEERNNFKSFQQEQQENIDRVLEEERQKCAETVKEALQKGTEKHKTEMEEVLKEEQNRSKESIEKAVEDAHKEGEKTLQQATEKAQEIHEKAIAELRESMEKMLQDERDKFKSTLEDVSKQERETSQRAIEEAVNEERTRGRESVQEAIKTTKEHIMEYLQHKQQGDAKVRQRQFVAMDLFLESARTQLSNLMETKHEANQHEDT